MILYGKIKSCTKVDSSLYICFTKGKNVFKKNQEKKRGMVTVTCVLV